MTQGYWAIQVLLKKCNAVGCQISWKKLYEDVRINVISVTRGWVGVKLTEKMCYVALEWPLSRGDAEWVQCILTYWRAIYI